MEPTWPKLVEPLEKIVDRLAVVWGAVSHLKAVKDNADLRSAIEEVQVHIDACNAYVLIVYVCFCANAFSCCFFCFGFVAGKSGV